MSVQRKNMNDRFSCTLFFDVFENRSANAWKTDEFGADLFKNVFQRTMLRAFVNSMFLQAAFDKIYKVASITKNTYKKEIQSRFSSESFCGRSVLCKGTYILSNTRFSQLQECARRSLKKLQDPSISCS